MRCVLKAGLLGGDVEECCGGIDSWLRETANCPMCRGAFLVPEPVVGAQGEDVPAERNQQGEGGGEGEGGELVAEAEAVPEAAGAMDSADGTYF